MNRSNRKPQPAAYPLAAIIAAAVIGLFIMAEKGCRKTHQIHQITEAKPQDRMLAAMIPVDKASWFFKVTGPRKELGALAQDFTSFVQSIKFDAEGNPTWTLPKDWTEKKGQGMRFATVSTPKAKFAITVNRFPTTEELANVNRWRRQMGLYQYWSDTDMRREITNLALADGKNALLCNFIGTAPAGGGGMAPFAGGGMGGHPPVSKKKGSSASSGAPKAKEDRIKFDAPPEWTAGTPTEMRAATFTIKAGKDQGEVTVMDLRHGKDDLKATVDIWRNRLGLDPISDSQIGELVSEFKVASGQQGQFIELAGKKESLLGSLVVSGQYVWVIRLTGSAALVKQEKDRFMKFVQSLRISTGK